MNTNFYPSADNYYKMLARLERNIRSGKFASYAINRKKQIWNRLCRYARQLGISIKSSVAAAFLAAGLSFANPSTAQQTFVRQVGANNPFNGVSVGYVSSPTFVDIDDDGDMDAFIGAYDGSVRYYQNTGTSSNPEFTEFTGGANPLSSVAVTYGNSPTFVDIDGDGDQDVFIGLKYGTVIYYENTGTVSMPVFTIRSGAANPLDAVAVGYYAVPAFVDIDGDGDLDAFIGTGDGSMLYYEDTGTATVPVFTQQLGANNPFNTVGVGNFAAPAFADIDGDGDQDVLIGAEDGALHYFKNTGTAALPVFAEQTGAANPFDGEIVGGYDIPNFVDIDADGDKDVFVGSDDGSIVYYQNTTPLLPLNLISFSGDKQGGYNQLQWQTTGEINTKSFELERSIDSRSFLKIATIKAAGNGNHTYNAKDNSVSSGKVFYRLRMVDVDGRFTYSQVIWINSGKVSVSIYPNPATQSLNLNIGNTNLLKTKAAMYDANGRLVQNIFITNEQQLINVQQFAKGRYIIKFADGTAQGFIKE